MPFAWTVAAADVLADSSAISAKATPASRVRRVRRAPMRDPTTRMRLAGLCSSEVNEALLGRHRRVCLEWLAEARPPHESSRPGRRHQLAVLDEDGAAQQDVLRGADDLGSLVEVVVARRMMR